jgi:hypothetical protein
MLNTEQAARNAGLDASVRQFDALRADSVQRLERQEKIAIPAPQVQDPGAGFNEGKNHLVLRSEADDAPGFRQTDFFG